MTRAYVERRLAEIAEAKREQYRVWAEHPANQRARAARMAANERTADGPRYGVTDAQYKRMRRALGYAEATKRIHDWHLRGKRRGVPHPALEF